MKVLIVAENESHVEGFVNAFEEKGFEARFLSFSQINLISKHKNTLIKAKGENIPRYDAVFMQARLNLAPFIEPLMDELIHQNIYVNCRPGSYYTCSNEPYEFVALALGHVDTIKTFSVGNPAGLESVAKKVTFPVMVKSFIGTEAQQALVVNSENELSILSKSIKKEMDGFIVREFINDDVLTCAVVGDKVFAVKRKLVGCAASKISEGKQYSISDNEKDTAKKAALVCGFDIAQVDMVDGKVIHVQPKISWKAFNKVTSEQIESHVAQLYVDKVSHFGEKKTFADDLKDFGKMFSKTVFGGIFK
jgi:glutathione synthase/RimK-type ligase-like ATP-grasp enzyme